MHGSRPISAEVRLLLHWLKSTWKSLESQVKTLSTGWGTFSQRGHSGKEGGTDLLPEDCRVEWFKSTCRKCLLLYYFLVSLLLRIKRKRERKRERKQRAQLLLRFISCHYSPRNSVLPPLHSQRTFCRWRSEIKPQWTVEDLAFQKITQTLTIFTILLNTWHILLIALVSNIWKH